MPPLGWERSSADGRAGLLTLAPPASPRSILLGVHLPWVMDAGVDPADASSSSSPCGIGGQEGGADIQPNSFTSLALHCLRPGTVCWAAAVVRG